VVGLALVAPLLIWIERRHGLLREFQPLTDSMRQRFAPIVALIKRSAAR
jgi:hypothetical protein